MFLPPHFHLSSYNIVNEFFGFINSDFIYIAHFLSTWGGGTLETKNDIPVEVVKTFTTDNTKKRHYYSLTFNLVKKNIYKILKYYTIIHGNNK